MADVALAAASKVQRPIAKAPASSGTSGPGANSPSIGSQSKVPANGVSVFKPGAVNGHPGVSKVIAGSANGLPHSTSAYNLTSKVQPIGAVPASHILPRSASAPNTAAANAGLTLVCYFYISP
jgi:hypothetical protein